MARCDELAAERELEEAARCEKQAQQLSSIAAALLKEAEQHLHVANDLSGGTDQSRK